MIIPHVPFFASPLLAQESVAANVQIEYILQQVLTPTGAVLTLLGMMLAIVALLFRRLMLVMALLALLCVMFQLHPDALTVNILLPPLQSFRFISKSLAFVLMCVAIVGVFQVPRLDERSPVGFAGCGLLAFQLLYTIQLLLFTEEGLAKGMLGLVSMSSMFVVFGIGFGRMMRTADSTQRCMETLVWVSIAFVAINLIQVVADVKGAFVGGRLTGICGNAQTLAAFSAIMLLINCYVYQASLATRPLKWISLLLIAALAAMVLASGSRTGALSTVVGILFMYRMRVVRLAIVCLLLLVSFYAVSYFATDTGAAVDRLISTENTRETVWSSAFEDFFRSPVLGQFPFLRGGDRLNEVESSFLRALANMGILGGVVLALPFAKGVSDAVRVYRYYGASPGLRHLIDLYIGSMAMLIVQNTFDGYVFGYLSLPAIYLYLHFTLGHFLASAVSQPEDVWQLDESSNTELDTQQVTIAGSHH
jgi:hypothetical protein